MQEVCVHIAVGGRKVSRRPPLGSLTACTATSLLWHSTVVMALSVRSRTPDVIVILSSLDWWRTVLLLPLAARWSNFELHDIHNSPIIISNMACPTFTRMPKVMMTLMMVMWRFLQSADRSPSLFCQWPVTLASSVCPLIARMRKVMAMLVMGSWWLLPAVVISFSSSSWPVPLVSVACASLSWMKEVTVLLVMIFRWFLQLVRKSFSPFM